MSMTLFDVICLYVCSNRSKKSSRRLEDEEMNEIECGDGSSGDDDWDVSDDDSDIEEAEDEQDEHKERRLARTRTRRNRD